MTILDIIFIVCLLALFDIHVSFGKKKRPKMRILLVRHGETIANVDRKVHLTIPDSLVPLTHKGIMQAQQAGRFIEDYLENNGKRKKTKIRIWRSPYMRARDTSDIIYENIKDLVECPPKELLHLAEQQYGLFDGLNREQKQDKFPEHTQHYNKHEEYNVRFYARQPMGESRYDVALRVHNCFGTFHRDKEDRDIDTIIIVAHGIVNRAFLMQWLHLSPEWFEKEPGPENCSIRLIEGGEDKGYIFTPE